MANSSPSPKQPQPILLFDGVCNLCDSAVQFVIDRDHKQRFLFAALQSEAAKAALDRAGFTGDLPDSMILIDGDRVLTRSTAALAVARRLTFPWSLLVIAYVVPPVIRDHIYGWIAKNRYRWFGRQAACRMPTPELKARFLDAEEPKHTLDSPSDSQSAAIPRPSLGLATLPGRFVLIYPFVFMLPFPLTLASLFSLIPGYDESPIQSGIAWTISLHDRATQPVIAWLGRLLTGENPSFEFTGSGDGLASYLGAMLNVIIASLVTVAWWIWRRATPVPPRVADTCRLFVRYYLAWVMLSYGFSKVFPLQFTEMGPDRLLQPYGDSSPMGLLWTFMGASPGYQMFAGAAEVAGALLLLFRRTALLGALVVAAVMTNVFAMNMFFDVPVKLYSFHYLAFAILIALPDAPRLAGLFLANITVAPRDLRPFWHGSRTAKRALGALKLLLIAALLTSNIQSRIDRMQTNGPWAPVNELEAIYTVESFEFTDPENPGPDSARWLRVGIRPPWSTTIQFADGLSRRMRITLDEEAATIAIYDRKFLDPPEAPMALERHPDGTVRLTGTFESRAIDVLLKRQESESLFHSRGFSWINEYPFNR